MQAKFASECRLCEQEIVPGDEIVKSARYGRYVHESCPLAETFVNPGMPGPGGRCEDAPCCRHYWCAFDLSSPGYGSYVGNSPYFGEER